tara:strand:+ start:856 stop:1176 length:321 start_codon:yes stop_codon:yes gene_type:complete
LVCIKDSKEIIIFDLIKQRAKYLEDIPVKNEKIINIERYSAFVAIQYEHSIEFVQFDTKELIESVSKIQLSEPIINFQQEMQYLRFFYVQTNQQIYLYDCDNILQN